MQLFLDNSRDTAENFSLSEWKLCLQADTVQLIIMITFLCFLLKTDQKQLEFDSQLSVDFNRNGPATKNKKSNKRHKVDFPNRIWY